MGPKHHLSFDAGLTWTDENRIEPEPDVDFLGAVLGLDYEWKISDNSSFIQALDFYPNFDESSDWRLTSMTALQSAVNSWLAVKLGYEVRYRNQPIGDNDDTDTTSTASVVFTF
jgi:putative salt-induced outer membrane protein